MRPLDRYSRQTIFQEIGEEGQLKLLQSKVAVIGMGALGTVIANNLCRAGVGYLRLVDRDYVELSNLQRQTLYNEQDAADQMPKAVAAVKHLEKINSEIQIEAVLKDVNSGNVESILDGMDLVVDGTDNLETRLLINDACLKNNIPWVHGAALAGSGLTMNIIPGQTPCLRCLHPELPAPGSHPTCSTAGVLGMITGIIGCLESTEAIKILIGSPRINRKLCVVNIWYNQFTYLDIEQNPRCLACVEHKFEYLNSVKGSYTVSLCGRDSIQVIPAKAGDIDFQTMAEKLKNLGTVKYNPFTLNFSASNSNLEITLFQDGRAIIKNVKDDQTAKSAYAEYIGL